MTTLDLTHLRDLARKATPGVWPEATWYGGDDGGFAAVGPHHETPEGESDEPGGTAEALADADARFIAALNPQTALALIDELEQAREVVEKAKACFADGAHTDMDAAVAVDPGAFWGLERALSTLSATNRESRT